MDCKDNTNTTHNLKTASTKGAEAVIMIPKKLYEATSILIPDDSCELVNEWQFTHLGKCQ